MFWLSRQKLCSGIEDGIALNADGICACDVCRVARERYSDRSRAQISDGRDGFRKWVAHFDDGVASKNPVKNEAQKF